MRVHFFALLLVMAVATDAHAYVGPGLGLGAIGAVVGALVAILLAIVGLVWYPVKRLFKRNKASKEKKESDASRQSKESP